MDEVTPDLIAAGRRRALGEAIKRHRGEMSQGELGAAIGDVPQTTISRWERGVVDLTVEQVLAIEIALDLAPGLLASEAGYVSKGQLGDHTLEQQAFRT